MQSVMMGFKCVQYIFDCLNVSVTAEPVYSRDQYAHSWTNPYKLYISDWYFKSYACFATVKNSIMLATVWLLTDDS